MKKLFAALSILVAAIAIPAGLYAWGPTRQTYTMAKPADHITFNSITDNPNIGDERNFVGARDASSSNVWYDSIKVQSGHEYLVRAYVHNNAAENLNLVAQDVTTKFNVPTTTGKSVTVSGFVTSSNATPKEIWDDTTFTSDQNFNLAYVPGSALYENNVFGPNGVKLSDNIVTNSGVLLGYNKLDGRIPGCLKYAGYVSFKVKPQFAPVSEFATNKRVSKHGVNQWSKDYTAQPGETVDFMIEYRNKGTVRQDDVTFRDTLPTGLSYVANSTTWANASGSHKASENLTNGVGINVGSYASNANAWVIFSSKVAANDSLPKCGENILENKSKVTTGGGSMESSANVHVTKTCNPPKECKPGIPEGDSRCTTIPTPPELPTTGIEGFASVLGLGAVATSAGYYVNSRRRA